jgi:hypothetical protein
MRLRKQGRVLRKQARRKASDLLVLTSFLSAILLGSSAVQLWAHHRLGWLLFAMGIALACIAFVL